MLAPTPTLASTNRNRARPTRVDRSVPSALKLPFGFKEAA